MGAQSCKHEYTDYVGQPVFPNASNRDVDAQLGMRDTVFSHGISEVRWVDGVHSMVRP